MVIKHHQISFRRRFANVLLASLLVALFLSPILFMSIKTQAAEPSATNTNDSIQDKSYTGAGDPNNPKQPATKATVPTSLSASLVAHGPGEPKGDWENMVIPAWRVLLGIANVFVIIVLLVLAVTNMARIQYDTYQIKKSLPLLIIGIVLANFSLLICRMFIDMANVLTKTFGGNDIMNSLFTPLVYNLGLVKIGDVTGAAGIIMMVATGGSIAIGLLILTLVLTLLPVIGLIVLVFLLYIRIAVLLALAVVSPVAFIMLAFPPTQGVFKTWWSWWVKWVFMKPAVFLILWLAVLLGSNGVTGDALKEPHDISIISWLITLGLTYFAFTVPFKLGDSIMGAWGKLGAFISGTGKGGYLRKGAEGIGERAKSRAGSLLYNNTGRVGNFLTKLKINARQEQATNLRDIEKSEEREYLRRGQEIKRKQLDAIAHGQNYTLTEEDKQVWKMYHKIKADEMGNWT